MRLTTGSDMLGLVHQGTFYPSLRSHLHIITLGKARVCLNHRQLGLPAERSS